MAALAAPTTRTLRVGYSCTFRVMDSWAADSCTAILGRPSGGGGYAARRIVTYYAREQAEQLCVCTNPVSGSPERKKSRTNHLPRAPPIADSSNSGFLIELSAGVGHRCGMRVEPRRGRHMHPWFGDCGMARLGSHALRPHSPESLLEVVTGPPQRSVTVISWWSLRGAVFAIRELLSFVSIFTD